MSIEPSWESESAAVVVIGDIEVPAVGGLCVCGCGDVINDYSFEKRLRIGDRLVFDDMSHYTMVKTSTFNGINLPSIAIWNSNSNQVKVIKRFGYADFKHRLS